MSSESSSRFADIAEARRAGMAIAFTASQGPDVPAIISERGSRTFGELNDRANRLVRALRERGLRDGDAVALQCSNRAEFGEVIAATGRSGLRFTPINWHLGADEVAYVVDDCEARAFIAEGERVAEVAAQAARDAPKATVRLAIGGPIEGFESYETALPAHPGHDIDDSRPGSSMLYTSGTTGRPKGVYRRRLAPAEQAQVERSQAEAARTQAAQPRARRGVPMKHGESLVLCTGPLYHAAPLGINFNAPLQQGIGVVLMDRWEPEETLRLIERYGVTHTHMVATMFHRLLALPEEVRSRYDISSLVYVIHGAAPTPVDVKKALIDWLGPIVYEYYAATEGGGTFITPEEWLEKPGSVGKANPGRVIEIRDDEGELVSTGEVGTVYFGAPKVGRFEYYKDAGKTASAYRGDSFTLGDHGYVDEDGYVFLTGRTSELIISGGVNIYPAEIDAVLLTHPAVADAAAVGVPNEEWGEEVKAVVELKPGHEPGEALADELVQYCRERLAHFKCPRSVEFDAELPRGDAGKVYRRKIRDRYWPKDGRQI